MQDVLLAPAGQRDVYVAFGYFTARVAVAVHAHRAEVYEVDVELTLDDGAERVVRRAHVVLYRVPLRRAVLHRVRRRALLCEVHHRVGLLILDELQEAVVLLRQVHVHVAQVLARHLIPRGHAHLGGADRRERARAQLDIDLPARKVVDDHHFVAQVRQVKRRRPPAEAIATQHEHLLLTTCWSVAHLHNSVPRPHLHSGVRKRRLERHRRLGCNLCRDSVAAAGGAEERVRASGRCDDRQHGETSTLRRHGATDDVISDREVRLKGPNGANVGVTRLGSYLRHMGF